MKTSFLLSVLLIALTIQAQVIYVSPDGDDNGDGTKSHPFATLK